MSVSIVRADNYDENTIDQALKEAFRKLGFDNTNPLKEIIHPGQKIFLKPNWVSHRYRASCPKQYDVFTTITHPTVIKVVARYIDIALDGKGELIIGDNPSIDTDFKKLLMIQKLDCLKEELQCNVRVLDLRPLVCSDLRHYGKRDLMDRQTGDPKGIFEVNLGKKSLLYGMNPKLFRGVFDERQETIDAHSGETHLYGFSKSIYQSDVFISIPKLKTHHKVGTTLNLKGLVGTIGVKNHLVHWRNGFPLSGGDAYPNAFKWLTDKFSKIKKRGAWRGNDTIWRMVVDLYHGFQKGPKQFFSVIDGVLGGQGNGPFCPEPINSNVLVVGTDMLETDMTATHLMGFDIKKISYLMYFLENKDITINDFQVFSDFFDFNNFFDSETYSLNFKPPDGWENLKRG